MMEVMVEVMEVVVELMVVPAVMLVMIGVGCCWWYICVAD